MVTFITGRANSGKTTEIFELLKEQALRGVEATLFVPEQFSSSYERLAKELLPSDFLKRVKILNFSRLCDEIKRLYGGRAGKLVDDSTRYMLLSAAIKSLDGELKLFKTAFSALRSIDTLSMSMKELATAGLSAEKLLELSEQLGDNLLSSKLYDLGKIYSAYKALLGSVYIDPIDDLDFTFGKIAETGYFKKKALFFDGFTSFTGQQYRLIRQAVLDAQSVYFAFCTDNCTDVPFSVFSSVNDTVAKIKKIAALCGCDQNETIALTKTHYSVPVLSAAESYLATGKFEQSDFQSDSENGGIAVYKADTKYDEFMHIAAEIHRLVRTKGYRFRDFCIISRNTGAYLSPLKLACKKLSVPLFADEKIGLSETVLSGFTLSSLRASRSFSTDEIMKLLKSGLLKISSDDVTYLQQYIYLWGIDGDDWKTDWVKNPFGLKDTQKPRIESALSRLNEIRKSIIKPLMIFKGSAERTAEDWCRAVYNYLSACNVPDQLLSYVSALKEEPDELRAQAAVSSWGALMAVLDNIVTCYEDDTLSYKEFYDLLNLNFEHTILSGIPEGLDEVLFTSADRLPPQGMKVAFVLGLNYGEFPPYGKDTGLFNAAERKALSALDVPLSDTYLNAAIEEDYLLYKSLTLPKERLCLSYHIADYSSGTCEISQTLLQLISNLKLSVKCSDDFSGREFLETPLQALAGLSDGSIKESDCPFVLGALTELPEYKENLSVMQKLDRAEAPDRIPIAIAEALYGRNIELSPSKIEQYFRCPYAYFYKYGLKITEQEKIDFKAMQRGTIAHDVLENVLKNHLSELDGLSDDNLERLISQYIEKYIIKTVGSFEALDAHAVFLLSRIRSMLLEIIRYIAEELKNSAFKPVAFELALKADGDIPPAVYEDNGLKLTLSGVVDRVDRMTDENGSYIRVVDYKTGKKEFRISDLLGGLNLQMFVYLSRLCTASQFGGTPAGVIYQPVNPPDRTGADAKETNSKKPKGVLTDDHYILSMMDKSGNFMPFSFLKDGSLSKSSVCISEEDFNTVFRYIEKKIIKMGHELADGNIKIDPCDENSATSVCTFCKYRGACHRNEDEENRVVPSLNTEETIHKMKEEI